MNAPVLLVNPRLATVSTTPFFVMPVGLLSLAAYLREAGIRVHCLDLNVAARRRAGGCDTDPSAALERALGGHGLKLVGASVMVGGQLGLAREVARSAKALLGDVVTVLGGAHVSQVPRQVLEGCPEVDFVVMGEGERQLLACARFALTGENPCEWPDGLAYRSDGETIVGPKVSYLQDLDSLPLPAYDLLTFRDYLHDTSTWHNPHQVELGVRVPIITSRGCPNLCNFCSVAGCMGQVHRPISATSIVDMMQRINEIHGAHYFAIFDANFAANPRRVLDMCAEINKRDLRFQIDIPTGLPVNVAASEMIDALAEVGLIRTCVSVESGDAGIRNRVMKKGIEQDQILEVVAAVRRHPQVFLLTDFVLGMPEDTEESLEASCRLIGELDTDDVALSIATPYPGTPLYRQCERDGLFMDDVDPQQLYAADWYTHANMKRFTIKPYRLDLHTLCHYRDRILDSRKEKISLYHERMRTVFGVESQYGRR